MKRNERTNSGPDVPQAAHASRSETQYAELVWSSKKQGGVLHSSKKKSSLWCLRTPFLVEVTYVCIEGLKTDLESVEKKRIGGTRIRLESGHVKKFRDGKVEGARRSLFSQVHGGIVMETDEVWLQGRPQ